jgi:hypothetical protein
MSRYSVENETSHLVHSFANYIHDVEGTSDEDIDADTIDEPGTRRGQTAGWLDGCQMARRLDSSTT